MIDILQRLVLAAAVSGAIALNMDEIQGFYEETMTASQRVTAAGDLRSISIMLDYEFMQSGRYPSERNFERWLQQRFQENELRELNRDQWGNTYRYSTGPDRRSFVLASAGPDGEFDTEDDMIRTGP
ncbi:general secretion pathway protein G [Desulfobotulus alkaliphilus]|uniref:General secretion pathway protein G n=1 Tax=Desulfobotulus alkaliphilus TaxID=622671 RepID=A0A562S6H9_9BACT|nr:type II secretion system protein GspG [Desulfobotulus alkaliphilus]TWI76713.1 general secretion pathway protein G [Desulfobotulus alkaliphilus]